MLPGAVDSCIFRLKPRHQEPREGKVWLWACLLHDAVDPTYRTNLSLAKKVKSEKIYCATQRSFDGPLIKWLLGLKKSDEEETEAGQKRWRGA